MQKDHSKNGTLPFQHTSSRLQYIDGLRGVAISGVVLYHSYSRWPELVPSAATYGDFPLFFYGGYGVELFFMISGFVILMTLEKSQSFVQFMFKRWTRLFPAMLFCSVLIYLTAPLLPERPLGAIALRDFLPGLTFLPQDFWQAVIGGQQGIIEASFWTLFVEMKFYVLFGACYFLMGARKAIMGLVALFFLHSLVITLHYFSKGADSLNSELLLAFLNALGAEYYGWFAAGACFYLYTKARDRNWCYCAIAATLFSAVLFKGTHADLKIAALIFGILFILAMTRESVRKLLQSPALIFVGFISYPLYLIHENMVVALTIKLSKLAPFIPSLLTPLLPIALAGSFAWLIAKYIEPPLRTALISHPWRTATTRMSGSVWLAVKAIRS
jgi:peptidoglycan/LPS O-acetylase OafA/YrhL